MLSLLKIGRVASNKVLADIMIQTLKNDLLTVKVSTHGAELQNITDNRTGYEYLWQGDSRFWGRRSPVLFPIVGAVWEGRYEMDGREYAMGQHGFARDCEFEVMDVDAEDEVWFALESSEETLKKYPRKFRLEIGYQLQGERLRVMWRVRNLDDREMSFQIGAHPAFNYPAFDANDAVHGYFSVDGRNLESRIIEEKGCVGEHIKGVELDSEGMMPITGSTFTDDALIFEKGQLHRVSLLDKERSPYLTMLFSSPLVGLWSPSAQAPFVCIEPWWGRCDSIGYRGDFSAREYMNHLAPGETFEATYLIIVDSI